jgi:hypothetical protein
MTDTARDPAGRRTEASGRFILRIDPGLHATLREAARAAGVSLNDYCGRKLAMPVGGVAGPAADVVMRAASQFGRDLVGVIAFGSWARGEAVPGSDVDVLVVVGPAVTIARGLYRVWDAEALSWQSHAVEAHIVHAPERGGRLTALWAEAAVDGVVLFDRDLSVSRRLAAIRRRIVAGEVIRRQAHGQPYWVEAA